MKPFLQLSDLLFTTTVLLFSYVIGTKVFGHSLGSIITITLRLSGVTI